MPTRKTLNIDSELAALQARADKLKADQKLMLGELVLETGIHKLLDADQIRDALIRARDHAKAAAVPREERPAGTSGTFPAAAEQPAKPNGHAEPEPTGHRHPDLLAGALPGRAGSRPVTEGAGNGLAS